MAMANARTACVSRLTGFVTVVRCNAPTVATTRLLHLVPLSRLVQVLRLLLLLRRQGRFRQAARRQRPLSSVNKIVLILAFRLRNRPVDRIRREMII